MLLFIAETGVDLNFFPERDLDFWGKSVTLGETLQNNCARRELLSTRQHTAALDRSDSTLPQSLT